MGQPIRVAKTDPRPNIVARQTNDFLQRRLDCLMIEGQTLDFGSFPQQRNYPAGALGLFRVDFRLQQISCSLRVERAQLIARGANRRIDIGTIIRYRHRLRNARACPRSLAADERAFRRPVRPPCPIRREQVEALQDRFLRVPQVAARDVSRRTPKSRLLERPGWLANGSAPHLAPSSDKLRMPANCWPPSRNTGEPLEPE